MSIPVSEEELDTSAGVVLGGTGMLAGATNWLCKHSLQTLIVARNASRFAPTVPHAYALDADWNSAGYCEAIRDAISVMPGVGRALLWLHEPERDLPAICDVLGTARVVLVLGSMDGQPTELIGAGNMATVKLGSMPTAYGRRWLTHDEISKAAIESLKDGQSRVVGELKPLS